MFAVLPRGLQRRDRLLSVALALALVIVALLAPVLAGWRGKNGLTCVSLAFMGFKALRSRRLSSAASTEPIVVKLSVGAVPLSLASIFSSSVPVPDPSSSIGVMSVTEAVSG